MDLNGDGKFSAEDIVISLSQLPMNKSRHIMSVEELREEYNNLVEV